MLQFNKIIRFAIPELQTFDLIKEKGVIANTLNNREYRSQFDKIQNDTIPSKKEKDKFKLFEQELSQYVVGQDRYLRQLSAVFQRSFLLESNLTTYKSLILVCGTVGFGKCYSIKVATMLLHKYGFLGNGKAYEIDMGKYTTDHNFDELFIPDLYAAFYGSEEVVIFNNISKACDKAKEMLTFIGIEGKLSTTKRFIESFGQLKDVSGSLSLHHTDYLSANNKILFFLTDDKLLDLQKQYNKTFLEKLDDIIETTPLSPDIMKKIISVKLLNHIEALERKIDTKLTLSSIDTITDFVLKKTKNTFEMTNAVKFIDTLENKLIDLVVSHPRSQPSIELSTDGEFLYANNNKLKIFYEENNNPMVFTEALKKIVGLNSVKEFMTQLNDVIMLQKANKNDELLSLSLHMIFTGNPGTGKTTIARIMSDHLKSIGFLSSGHIVEVSRADLVGQYVGETAQKTTEKIKSALGGVLFIDEAYSLCTDKHDSFGMEAVNTLVKAMEDHRDDLIIILAGYSDDMARFLETNAGLKSRFNYFINFEDYTPEELMQISSIIATEKGYRISKNCYNILEEYFSANNILGKKDNGNGRLARNVIEKAIINSSKRILSLKGQKGETEDCYILYPEDFDFYVDTPDYDLEMELSCIIGLNNVKSFIKNMEAQILADKKRKDSGIETTRKQSLNILFTGNPGTGKTTIARIIAKMFYKIGVLKKNLLVEVDRSELVAEYVGHTAIKTKNVFMSALGGVLFIDEAYSLCSDNFGMEAISTLLKLMEDYRENIVVILSGYEKEMTKFLASNSGLKSRFNITLNFPDYTSEEMLQIAKKIAEDTNYYFSQDIHKLLKEIFENEKKYSETDFGNGRFVRNVIESAISHQSLRIASDTSGKEDLKLLKKEDFCDYYVKAVDPSDFNINKALDNIIGLEKIKSYILQLYAVLKINKQRKEQGLLVESSQTLHMVFAGNPGTGKTMVARIICEVLYSLGYLKENKYIEVDRSGLIAEYVGQTAIKTRDVFMKALGGVLFIDEAYSLSNDAISGNGFGKEAIDTLLKLMEDYREEIVVILAGYEKEMRHLMSVNPGLESRFANFIVFENYTEIELMAIAKKMFESYGYSMNQMAEEKTAEIFSQAILNENFANARYARNFVEKAIRNQALRLCNQINLTSKELTEITEEDI